jgi:hypothetical protein
MSTTMTVETLRSFFLWCSVLNLGFLGVWGMLALFLFKRMSPFFERVWGVSGEQFQVVTLVGITFYKMATFLFFIIPCVVLYFLV